jgi:hypothetical protein
MNDEEPGSRPLVMNLIHPLSISLSQYFIPGGYRRQPDRQTAPPSGLDRLGARPAYRQVWDARAEDPLAAGDAGLIACVSLSRFDHADLLHRRVSFVPIIPPYPDLPVSRLGKMERRPARPFSMRYSLYQGRSARSVRLGRPSRSTRKGGG